MEKYQYTLEQWYMKLPRRVRLNTTKKFIAEELNLAPRTIQTWFEEKVALRRVGDLDVLSELFGYGFPHYLPAEGEDLPKYISPETA